MPHKHTRRGEVSNAHFDLPPTKKARPLPTFQTDVGPQKKQKGKNAETSRTQHLKRKRTETNDYKEDDTPRAFARAMRLQATGKRISGLDNGDRPKSKKVKNEGGDQPAPKPSSMQKTDVPRILPGERLADYNARVDQALPLGDVVRKGKKVEGMNERQTKTEKRLKKMYAEWREEDAKIKESLEEAQELQEEADEELEAKFGAENVRFPESRKARRRRMIGEAQEADDDPWKILKAKREAPRGLHDVVEAPPTFTAVPKEKFKVKNNARVQVANVPAAAGSLKRREELGEARKEVIERYRAMMKGSKA